MTAIVPTSNLADPSIPLPLRAHTILGVCEGLGEDFGFNANWLRVPLAASVLFSPTYAILGYFALGLVVLASRLIFPRPKLQVLMGAGHGRSARGENDQAETLLAA